MHEEAHGPAREATGPVVEPPSEPVAEPPAGPPAAALGEPPSEAPTAPPSDALAEPPSDALAEPPSDALAEPPSETRAEAASDAPDRLDRLTDRLGDELAGLADRVTGELAGLRAELARTQDRAAAREQVIDRLHEENQRLRAGERRLLLRPLLTDLQRLRHDLLRTAAGLPPTFDATAAAEMLRSYAANLELTLERGGVSVLAPAVGAVFDPSTQRATATEPASDPGQHGTVAAVVLDGYHDVEAGRTAVPAAVRVHRWTDPEPPAGEPHPEPGHGNQHAPTP
ncbi:nucleotide exchange factor GrpE [Micromonospora sp. NPDC048898]|uniref:nucleotide exchange factor GrpE n=1 Tax=Micromonospora sp. NPDC048898 TaxID=3364260 RepID=UPI0037137FD7